MGVTLTDVLLFGKAQSDDVDNATLVIYRRNILRWSALGGYLDIIVKGVSPISLPDAIANSLEYLKAFGGTEQRNIPQPYTQVNYVTNTAQTAVDTGIMIDFAKNYEFEVECRAVSGSWYILQSRASSSGNITGIHGATSGSTITLVVGNVTICTSAITRTVGNKLYVKATLNAGTATLYVKDETANTEDTQTGSYGTSQPNPTASVYLLGNAGGQYADVNSDIYMARIKENDTVVMDYVPARQVATAGFYDTVSGTFKTAITASSLVADGDVVPTPDTPMDIVSNNGVLRTYPDIHNTATDTLGAYLNINNAVVGNNGFGYTDYIAVVPGKAYDFGARSGSEKYILTYDENKNYLDYTNDPGTAFTYTPASGVAYIRCNFERSYQNFAIRQQGIYTDGEVETIADSANHTATVATLLGIGDYRDTQNINTGAITRNVGIKVLDGTEDWTYNNSSFLMNLVDRLPQKHFMFCTHFNYNDGSSTAIPNLCIGGAGATNTIFIKYQTYNTAKQFKQFLADQYAAGTPVIIIYPLATPTTESVAGQTLQVQAGDNTLEITQASLNGLELEAQYQAAVSLTIQEVQDANLDPNVEVTIN